MKQFTSFDGTEIAYHDHGDGPAVVLLHGFVMAGMDNFGPWSQSRWVNAAKKMHEEFARMSHGDVMLEMQPELPAPPEGGAQGLLSHLIEAGFRVLLPDARGHGSSAKPRGSRHYADYAMARDVLALIEHEQIPSAGVLGYSMGAVTTTHLLALPDPRVNSVVIGGMGAYVIDGNPAPWPPVAGRPATRSYGGWCEYNAQLMQAGSVDDDDPMAATFVLCAEYMGADLGALSDVWRGHIATQVPIADLEAVNFPVLVLNGTEDVLQNATWEELVAAIPTAQAGTCPGDHLVAPFEPSFQEQVQTFFAANAASRPGGVSAAAS
jgi:pimeloyl-ACP methyl ester carboxylesterase